MTSAAIALTTAASPSSTQTSSAAFGVKGTASIEHAQLDMYEAKAAQGGSQIGQHLGSIPFQFNPKELSISKAAKWERKTARGAKTAGPPEFTGADPCKMTLEMFFDASGTQADTVVASVEKLFSCCTPTAQSTGQNKAMPPLVVFNWGSVSSFAAYISQVSVKYTLFAANGIPLRATASVTLEEMPGNPPGQNPTSGALAVQRVHQMVAGDSLPLLAHREYGNPNLWRHLARYNGIDDPMRIPSGMQVLLPAPEDLVVVEGD